MRDYLLVVIKKADQDEISKPDIDEVAKEVVADDDCSLEHSHGLCEVSPNISSLDTRRMEIASITKTRSIQGSSKRIQSTMNKVGMKVPKENFVQLTPEKEKPLHKDTGIAPKSGTVEIIESDEYLIITLKASRRRKNPKSTSAIKSIPKESESPVAISEVKFENEVFISRNAAAISNTIPIQQRIASEKVPSIENPDALCGTVSPIVLHGAAKAFEKYDEIPNEDFYSELRDFNKSTRWNKNIQKRQRSITTIPNSKKCSIASKLYPTKFATFLIRVSVPMTETQLPEDYKKSVLEINATRSDKTKFVDALETSEIEKLPQNPLISKKLEDKYIEFPKSIEGKKSLGMLTSKDTEIPDGASLARSSATRHIDPLSINPIRFRKELRALCRSKSHDEPIMISSKRCEEFAKYGAIPKIPTSPKVKEVEESSPNGSGSVRATLKRKREEREMREKIRDPKNRFSKVEYTHEVMQKKFGAFPESNILPEWGSLSETSALPEPGASPEPLIETEDSPELGDLPGTGASPEPGDLPETALLPENIPFTHSNTVLKTRTGPTFRLKYKQAKEKSFQFRDIPVVAYVSRSRTNQRNMNLKKLLKEKDFLGYYWKKFKHYKRYESERQQILLDEILFAVPEVDAAMYAAQKLTFRIEILRQENCETEECLRKRNSRMKWLMSRLVGKTMKINSLLESIRCNVVMYTLEANASNSGASGRLDTILKFFCEADDCTRYSVRDLETVEEGSESKIGSIVEVIP